MLRRIAFFTGVFGVLSSAVAQAPPQQPTTVQLPSFSFFSVSTTVMVPDSARGYGRVYAGGNNFAASGRNEFGPPFLAGNRATGAERRAAGMFVSAQIHDLDAWGGDHLLTRPELRAARATPLPRTIGREEAPPQVAARDEPIRSVAAIRQDRDRKTAEQQTEALALLERGRKCEAEGKPGAAKVYYQMAATRSEGELRAEILAAIKALPDARPSASRRD
jgi:hypothetical protein